MRKFQYEFQSDVENDELHRDGRIVRGSNQNEAERFKNLS